MFPASCQNLCFCLTFLPKVSCLFFLPHCRQHKWQSTITFEKDVSTYVSTPNTWKYL